MPIQSVIWAPETYTKDLDQSISALMQPCMGSQQVTVWLQLISDHESKYLCYSFLRIPTHLLFPSAINRMSCDIHWLDTVCHGSKRSSSCHHVNVRTEESISMNIYQLVHGQCMHANLLVIASECVYESLINFRVSMWASYEHVWRASGPLWAPSLFFISALHFCLLFEVARGYCALISCIGLSLIYVLVD